MNIALYLRLSESDGDLGENGKDESNSIENQRMLLRKYIEDRDEWADSVSEILEYVDDGHSGTNFNRPSFKRMLEDAKKGLIQIILVKDLSRLGRDYITVGDYIEQIFPMLGIRFVAVTNGYDSSANGVNSSMGFDMAVSNLINTFYSRDLSKKLKAANRTRWKNGISTSGIAPFGYEVSKERKGKWDIDSEAAEIVRLIFEKAVAGYALSDIAEHLNEHGYPTPWMYHKIHQKRKQSEFNTAMSERLWDNSKVRTILTRYEYTGAMVMGRSKARSLGSKQTVAQPETEWTIVEDVNEAIVSKEFFEKVAISLRRRKNPDYQIARSYALKGKVFCGTCRCRMGYEVSTYKEIFRCSHSRQIGKHSKCCRDEYPMDQMEKLVLCTIQKHISLLRGVGNRLQSLVDDQKTTKKDGQKNLRLEKEKIEAEKIRLYERYAEHSISREVYIEKKAELSEKIQALEESEVQHEMQRQVQKGINESATKFLHLADDFGNEDKLTAKMVQAFIDGVYIYDKNRIEVVFLFEDELHKMMQFIEHEAKTITA